jgi:hypothetical protein
MGSLMWAAIATRPDIAFTVSLLSQFMENPGEAHWEAINSVFKYLKGTKNKLIIGKIKNSLVGYSGVIGPHKSIDMLFWLTASL